jgi:DNA-directed RNA polymerase sigma subunit (sigma70/sigma32)
MTYTEQQIEQLMNHPDAMKARESLLRQRNKRAKKVEAKAIEYEIKANLIRLGVDERSLDRNLAIWASRYEGKTFEEIGVDFNLTRERIRDICNQVIQAAATEGVMENRL